MLAEQIRAIERKYAGGEVKSGAEQLHPAVCIPTGWADIDEALGGGLLAAALHEWFLENVETPKRRNVEIRAAGARPLPEGSRVSPRDVSKSSDPCHTIQIPILAKGEEVGKSGCEKGFSHQHSLETLKKGRSNERQATGDEGARKQRDGWTAPVCLMVHLVWQALEANPLPQWTVWIGRRCFPYPGVLVREKGGDRRLLERSIFVSVEDAAGRLEAIDLALRSPAIGAVAADGSAFPMAATRRIQLVAKKSQILTLLARPPWEENELSAAQTRWRVNPQKVETLKRRNVETVVNPRWSVELLRCKGGQPQTTRRVWELEWNRGTGVVHLSAPLVRATGNAKKAKSAS